MGNVKTVTISAETAVKFDAFYPYVWIKNTGDTIAYAAAFSGIVAGAENVVAVPAGESVMITAETDTVYILSTGTTAEVHGQGYAESPFLDNYSEGSGTSITVESLSVTDNGVYTAPSGKAYSPVSVDVQPTLGTKSITTNGTYTASSDNLDGYSSVTVNIHDYPYGDVLFDNFSANSNNATLSKAYTSYEEIVLIAAFGGNTIVTQKIPTSQINIGNNIGVCTDTSYLWLTITSTTALTQNAASFDGVRLVKIIGMEEISND